MKIKEKNVKNLYINVRVKIVNILSAHDIYA